MSEKPAKKPKPPSGAPAGPMDVGLLEQIVQLMSANDLNTVDVRDGDRRVILKRGAASGPVVYTAAPPAGGNAPSPPSAPAALPGKGEEATSLIPIKSPMVGTFYSAAAKGAKPLVTVGAVLDEETDVCIIEAMKVFNNIKAECRGIVEKILVHDGQPVEFGTTLFLVKPA